MYNEFKIVIINLITILIFAVHGKWCEIVADYFKLIVEINFSIA